MRNQDFRIHLRNVPMWIGLFGAIIIMWAMKSNAASVAYRLIFG